MLNTAPLFSYVPVRDLPRAQAFYEEKVGLNPGVPTGPGLGVDIDLVQLEAAHELYKRVGGGARDDAVAMQHLIPGWTYDNKRPALVR